MKDFESFIRNLELSEGDNSCNFKPVFGKEWDLLEGLEGEAGIMNFKSLNSFTSGVSTQHREDILNSLLLAQRVATRAFPNDEQVMDWYEKYFNVLENIGWVIENKEFATFSSRSDLLEIESAILDILGAALTGNQLAVLSATIKAFKSLGENDKRFHAFEKNTHSLLKGSFQLGVATEENGALSLSAGSFILKTYKNITKIFFFKTDRDSAELIYSNTKATLHEGVYSQAREMIRERLGDSTAFVADLEI
jgi:hypothetical protein